MKKQFILCTSHQPKATVVNRITGKPLEEGILKETPKPAMCFACVFRIYQWDAVKIMTKDEFEAMVKYQYSVIDKSQPFPEGTILPVRSRTDGTK